MFSLGLLENSLPGTELIVKDGFQEFYKLSNKAQEGLWCVQGHSQCDVTLG